MPMIAGKVTPTKVTSKKSLDEILAKKKVEIKKTNTQKSNVAQQNLEEIKPIKQETVEQSTIQCEGPTFEELKDLFGTGFSECEYRDMFKRYTALQNNYPLRTEMHKEALITYVKYAFKRDQAIASDDMDAADKWGKLCAKQATDAKINPSQLSAADLSDGINNFSKIAEAVEREQDIIPLLPQFKQRPQDVVDYTLWQYVNYIRRLQNMPEIKYADIYNFMNEAYEKNKDELSFLSKPIDGKYDATSESV